MSQKRGRRAFHLVAYLAIASLVIFGFAHSHTLWQAWLIHRPECVVWTGNYAVGADRGALLWGVEDRSPYAESVRCGDRVIMVRDEAALECRSLLDGTAIWKAPAASSGPPSPARSFSIALAGSVLLQAGKEGVRGFAAETGAPLWTIGFTDRFADYYRVISFDEGFVLIGGLRIEYYDLATRKLCWRKEGKSDDVRPFDEKSVVGAIDGDIVRLSVESDTELWRLKGTETGHYVRVFAAGHYVIAGSDGKTPWTSCLDGATGNILWSPSGQAPFAAALAPDRKHLLLALSSGWPLRVEVVALRTSTWVQVWSHRLEMGGVEMVFEDDKVFVGSYEPISFGAGLQCLDVAQGSVLWTAEVRGIPVPHSKYSHAIKLLRRESWISLIGRASAGDYVETFDAKTGSNISCWRSREGIY